EKGDVVSAKIGWAGGKLLPCGEFQIDEDEHTNEAGDVVVIKALAAGVNDELRTKRSLAHEQASLRDVAQKVALRHGLQLIGQGGDDIRFERIHQHHETDLGFLRRLAHAYGYSFSVRGRQLVFHDLAELD